MAPFDDTLFLRSSVDVLSFFNEEQLRKVTPDIERRSYRSGQTVILRGEISSGFYIIKKGKATAVYKPPAGMVSQPLGVGDFFGVMTLLQDMPSDAASRRPRTTPRSSPSPPTRSRSSSRCSPS